MRKYLKPRDIILTVIILAITLAYLHISTKPVPTFTWGRPLESWEVKTNGFYGEYDGRVTEQWHNLYKSWCTKCSYSNKFDEAHYAMIQDRIKNRGGSGFTWYQPILIGGFILLNALIVWMTFQ